jgi:hypothetical protein
MLIWKGLGILVPFVLGFVTFATLFAVHAVLGEEVSSGNWAVTIGVLMSGVACWFLGRHLHDPQNGKVLIDPESGGEVLLMPTHSLFFIKVEYWGILLGGLATFMMADQLLR